MQYFYWSILLLYCAKPPGFSCVIPFRTRYISKKQTISNLNRCIHKSQKSLLHSHLLLREAVLYIPLSFHILPWYYLSILLFLPLSVYLFYLIYEFIYYPKKEFKKHWWLGPIGRWKEIEQSGLGWFALRWYTARNITQFISIAIIICAIISY